MSQGRSLELFFINGNPDGMLTAEVFNWTGHVLVAPRVQIKDALARREARHTGVYVLLGDQGGNTLAYVGEGEDVAARIRDHDARKDWWSKAIIITSAADSLHKAHAKYLESRLVEMARVVASVPLENGATPTRSSLSEAAQANMEEFLETLGMVLPALGITMFQSKRRPAQMHPSTLEGHVEIVFELKTPKHQIEARAELRGGEFVVLSGSFVRKIWAGKGEHDFGYQNLHKSLVASGVIDVSATPATFTENYAFNSPSAAAAVVNGRPANGRTEWKLAGDGRTLKQWEQDELSTASSEETSDG